MAIPAGDRQVAQEQLTGIVGLTTAAVPATPVGSTANGDLKNADLVNIGVAQTIISVPTGTIVAAQVTAGTNLANRKLIIIQANVANMVYGFSATLTPFSFPLGSTFTLALGANVTLYVGKSGTGAGNFSIAELA